MKAAGRPSPRPGGPAGALRAGAAQAVVTPAAEGTFLIGPMKPSSGVHDDLYARALVLDDGATRAAIVTVDALGFDLAYSEVLIGAVADAAGTPCEHVMVNCSHTHSAPLTAPWGPWRKHRDEAFHEMLPKALRRITKEACGRLAPATLRYAREGVQVGFNRRLRTAEKVAMAPNPKGAVVPWVDVLAAEPREPAEKAKRPRRADRAPAVAVLFSHAAHPVVVHAADTRISADYPGFAVEALRAKYSRRTVFLFAQGCAGNVNAFPLRGGIDAARAVGRDLAAAVERALAREGDAATGPLRVAHAELSLPLQPPPSAEEKPTLRFPIRAFAVGGELCLLGLSHEPFAEYQLHVERTSPFRRTMVFGYTNGLDSYVGTAAACKLGGRGGYETSPRGAASLFECGLPPAARSERIIRKGIADVLRRLWAG